MFLNFPEKNDYHFYLVLNEKKNVLGIWAARIPIYFQFLIPSFQKESSVDDLHVRLALPHLWRVDVRPGFGCNPLLTCMLYTTLLQRLHTSSCQLVGRIASVPSCHPSSRPVGPIDR